MTTALLSLDTTESINCNVDAFGTFISDWESVSPEDLIVNRSLQNKIQTAILKAAQSILQLKSDEIGDDDDDKESNPPRINPHLGHPVRLPTPTPTTNPPLLSNGSNAGHPVLPTCCFPWHHTTSSWTKNGSQKATGTFACPTNSI
jgi:hypothetical protein